MKTKEILASIAGMGVENLNNVSFMECATLNDVEQAMKIYANQKLDEAAEKAEVSHEVNPNWDGTFNSTSCSCIKTIEVVDKQSILNLKDEI